MKELGIDIETYSSRDLAACGVYKYSEAPDFDVLLFSYSVDGGPVRCVDFASGEYLPREVRFALDDPAVIKTAYNAAFERVCLSRYFLLDERLYDPAQWRCTMVRAARLGFPLPLGQCAEALRLEQGKMEEGRALIRLFSTPGRDGRRTWPRDEPEKWERFKAYNIRDVQLEQAVLAKVRRLKVPPEEDELYVADQEINDRGVRVDTVLVEQAARFDREYKARLAEEARALTGMENPGSAAQLKEYLHRETGIRVESLDRKGLDELEAGLACWPRAQRAIALRRELGKTSNRKYEAVRQCVCRDGRVRGLMQFCGAARTGRWAGRLVQVQNLPQNHMEGLDEARRLVKAGDLEEFELSFPSVTQALSELVRTAFIPSEGKTLHVCDFSAIEARVIAWLAGEEWMLDAFRSGRDIYCETAAKMFRVPVEKHGRNAHLRQRGKVAVLALGYGGGVAALEAMGGKKLGLTATEERDIVAKWRDANPHITRLWTVVEQAAMAAVRTGKTVEANRGLEIGKRWGTLMVTLPSGRAVCYPRADIAVERAGGWREGREVIEYEGINQTTRKWERIRTYGGKMVENIVQAIARDILGAVLLRARREGMEVVFHVHDEVVVEAPAGQPAERLKELFGRPISWCRDLPLEGTAFSAGYYLKG